jgi:hypothetical protein
MVSLQAHARKVGMTKRRRKGRDDNPRGSSAQERRRPGIHSTGQS